METTRLPLRYTIPQCPNPSPKSTSSIWIKAHGQNHAGFAWQTGYGTFSIGASQLATLTRYIDEQESHHATRTFQDEYRALLRKYGVEFDERYVWD